MSCANCVTGTLHEGDPTGKEDVMTGLSCYVSGDPRSKKIIVFGTDIFGWTLRNSRLLADQYAERGYYVVMPDLFDGMH
jgi:dienelactone hydrolase